MWNQRASQRLGLVCLVCLHCLCELSDVSAQASNHCLGRRCPASGDTSFGLNHDLEHEQRLTLLLKSGEVLNDHRRLALGQQDHVGMCRAHRLERPSRKLGLNACLIELGALGASFCMASRETEESAKGQLTDALNATAISGIGSSSSSQRAKCLSFFYFRRAKVTAQKPVAPFAPQHRAGPSFPHAFATRLASGGIRFVFLSRSPR